jgi:hypothetical protein
MLICVYESRADCEPGIRLLIATLAEHAPGQAVRLHFNPAGPEFARWIAGFPDVDFRPAHLPPALYWNVKPQVLVEALDDGHDQLLWLDSDLLIAAGFTDRFAAIDHDVLILAEEALWGGHFDGDALRTRAWGFEVGRSLPFAVNSAVMRVSARHRPLVEAWGALLDDPDYRAAQAQRAAERPVHMVGDQDVLGALLCSRAFAGIELHLLRRGRDILQLFGLKAFTVRERLIVLLSGLPAFVHAQGAKPWRAPPPAGGRFGRLGARYAASSPYLLIARRYRGMLGDRTWLGRARRSRGIALAGLPLAILIDALFLAARLRRRLADRN